VNPKSETRNPKPERILVRGVNWLGDAVMTTPALLRLREHFHDAHITLLTPEKLRDLWANHPAINETVPFAPGENVFSIGKKLRSGKFDLALIFPNSPRSVIETWLAGIPQRMGHARPWRNFFLTNTIALRSGAVKMQKRSIGEIQRLINSPVGGIQNSKLKTQNFPSHQIHEYLHLAAALGANPEPLPPKLFVAPDETEVARKKFGLNKIAQPIFGLNAGAEYGPAKRWPAERFIAAAREIQQRTNCVWLILGGKGDLAVANRIESGIQNSKFKTINLTGQTSLRELMSFLKLCRVLLTNDTGPMHVAAALGKPLIALFGPTEPRRTGPYGQLENVLRIDLPCSPCMKSDCHFEKPEECLRALPAALVFERAQKLLLPRV
jgi:ADP-heptose:LPS heptosyltransferase